MELVLPPEAAATLRRDPAFAAPGEQMWRASNLRRVWFDTPSGKLAARNLALAEDQGGWQIGPIHTNHAAWLPQFTWSTPSPTAAAAIGESLDEPLMPIEVLDGKNWRSRISAREIDICLLDGRWQTLAEERPFCRLHLAGHVDAVTTLASMLALSHPLSVPLASPTAEALAFARGEALNRAAAGPLRLSAGHSVEECFVEIATVLTEALVIWSKQVPAGHDPAEPTEPVHQMRVVLRRLRSALRAFVDILSCPTLTTVAGELKTLASILGPVRDWDVFINETLAEVSAALPQESSLLRLRRAAVRLRRAEYAKLHAYLSDGRFARLTIDLAGLTLARPWTLLADDMLRALQRRPIKDHAARVLCRRRAKMQRAGENILTLPPMALHDLRLSGKQLRYLAEFFGPLFSAKASERLVRRLSRLQERLGSINDAQTAGTLMQALPPATRHAQGIVQGFVAGRAGTAKNAVLESWNQFTDQKGFW